MRPVTGKGFLTVILMHALDLNIEDAQTYADYVEVFAKKHGYTVVVKKTESD